MLLTIKDLDVAADTVVRYLNSQNTPSPNWGFDIRARSRACKSEARVAESIVTPSGKLFQITENREQGRSRPNLVQLSFTEPSQQSYAPLDKTEFQSIWEEELFNADGVRILRRNRAGVERSYQEEPTFHLLLPEMALTSPDENKGKVLICPVCRWKFQPTTPEQRFCCNKCEAGKPKQSRHAKDCTRTPPSKNRRLRKILRNVTLKVHPDRQVNLVAGERDKDSIFLQLTIYAARRRWLDYEVETEAFLRFEKHFKKTVGHLSRVRRMEGQRREVVRSILADAWEGVKRGYCSIGEGFSHYVRRIINRVKQPPFLPSPARASAELGMAGFKKRGRIWTNRDPDQEDVELSPREAATSEDVKERTFYALIEKGLVPAERRGTEIILLPGWRKVVREWKKEKRAHDLRAVLNKVFAWAWTKKRKISFGSAKTHIKRWRGLEDTEIMERIGDKWVQEAGKSRHQFLTKKEIKLIEE